MLLIDRILNDPNPRDLLTKSMFDDLTLSAKFVLDPRVSRAADEINLREFDKVHAHVRPPYKVTWLETLHAARPRFTSPLARSLSTNEVTPLRVGVLIHALDDDFSAYNMALFWDTQQLSTWTCSLYNVCVDYNDRGWAKALVRKRHGSPVVFSLAGKAEAPVVLFPNEAQLRTIASLGPNVMLTEKGTALMEKLKEQGLLDWGGEVQYWTSVLALLNTKNVVDIAPGEPRRKLNKARVRKGQLPLFEYKVCKLVLGRAERRGGGPPSTRDEIRLHFVRGHYKVRKTGIYWWSPHKRGSELLGRIEKDYSVSVRDG